MATNIGSIIRQATRNNEDRYNCLTFPTHERYQSNLANTFCDYYMLQGTPGVKENGWITKYANMPKNHILLEKQNNVLESIPSWMNPDFVLGQHRFGQAQTSLQIAKHFGIKSIILEHTTVTNDNLRRSIPQLREIRGDINIFISKSSCEAWGWDLNDLAVRVIEHGVDSKLFKPNVNLKNRIDQPYVLCVVNDWKNRGDILGWDMFNRVIMNNKIPVRILGDNPGISQPPQHVYELVQEYNKATVFYNTSIHSPIPCVLLEAMACELPVVTTDNYLISEIIENGVNGYKTNSEAEQLNHIRRLLKDKDEREQLGKAARQTILTKFNLARFVSEWDEVFGEMVK
jgi:hypothetical protein